MAGGFVPPKRLAQTVERIAQPPAVTIHLPGERTHGVLLCWGRHPAAGWVAGVALLCTQRHHRALVTIWLPGHLLQPSPTMNYANVPRTVLQGSADQWPTLPPVYPGAAAEWRQRHRHETYRPERR